MASCIGCKSRGTYWCTDCEQAYLDIRAEVRGIVGFLGEHYSEGHLTLTGHELLESERLIEMTPLGKASMMNRAYELLMEVEDHFANTPMCPGCRKHKMVLETGEPLVATCTGGCVL